MLKQIWSKLTSRQADSASEGISSRLKSVLSDQNTDNLPDDKLIGESPSAAESASPAQDVIVGNRVGQTRIELPPEVSPQELDRMSDRRKAIYLLEMNYRLRDIIGRLQRDLERAEVETRRAVTDYQAINSKMRTTYRGLLRICEQFPEFVLFKDRHRNNLSVDLLTEFLSTQVIKMQNQAMVSNISPAPKPPAAAPSAPEPETTPQPVLETGAQVQDEVPAPQPSAPEPELASEVPGSAGEDLDQASIMLAQRYMERLDDQQKKLILVIGSTGLAQIGDIFAHPEIGESFGGRHAVTARLNEIKNMGLLKSSQIKTGARGHMFIVFELSDKGVAIYRMLTGKDPVPSEVKLLTDAHGSLEHGYLIKVAAQILRDHNYTVHQDRKACTFYVDDEEGKRLRIVYDLVAEKPDGERIYIEVERGTHVDDDFYYKLDKIYRHTQVMHFIAPNDRALHAGCKRKFNDWVLHHRGGKNNVDVEAYFTTIDRLKRSENDWEIVNLRKVV